MSKTLDQRFWEKVDKAGDCWLWTASCFSNGYGQFGTQGPPRRNHLAHRMAYELDVGPIPANLELDHLCENKRCVNPRHLEIVTRRENQLRTDGIARRNSLKTRCNNGHPFDAVDSRGARRCLTCDAAAARRYRRRLKEEHATTS